MIFIILLSSCTYVPPYDSVTVKIVSGDEITEHVVEKSSEYIVPEIENPGYELVSITGSDGKKYVTGQKIKLENDFVLTYLWNEIVRPIKVTISSDGKITVFETNEGSPYTIPFKYRDGYELLHVSDGKGGNYQPGATIDITQDITLTYEWKMISTAPSDFIYEVNGNEVTIIKYTGRDWDLVIPSDIEGKPVTKIALDTSDSIYISSFVIPDTVLTIESLGKIHPNMSEERIATIDIPETVKQVGKNAFSSVGCLINIKGDTSSWDSGWNMTDEGKVGSNIIYKTSIQYSEYPLSRGGYFSSFFNENIS